MEKKIYLRPATLMIDLHSQCILTESVTDIGGDGLGYGGGGNGDACVKEAGDNADDNFWGSNEW